MKMIDDDYSFDLNKYVEVYLKVITLGFESYTIKVIRENLRWVLKGAPQI